MTDAAPSAVEAAQVRIMELFGQLCGDPDNVRLARDADQALEALEGFLGDASPAG
jgi:hypothetical protein